QEILARLQHDLLAEVILSLRILDVRRLEQCCSNRVLIENSAWKPLPECARQSALTRPWQSGHDHDHRSHTVGPPMPLTLASLRPSLVLPSRFGPSEWILSGF